MPITESYCTHDSESYEDDHTGSAALAKAVKRYEQRAGKRLRWSADDTRLLRILPPRQRRGPAAGGRPAVVEERKANAVVTGGRLDQLAILCEQEQDDRVGKDGCAGDWWFGPSWQWDQGSGGGGGEAQ